MTAPKKRLKLEDLLESPALPTPPAPVGPSVRVIHPSVTNKKTFVAEPGAEYVMANSRAKDWATKHDLSPFLLGPCRLYGGHVSHTMENGWHFSKVFIRHVGANGNPTADYFTWAKEGWNRKKAAVEMLGISEKPAFFWWDGQKLEKVAARKTIYVPLYAEQVVNTRTFESLHIKWLMMKRRKTGTLYLMEFDCYDYTGKTLSDVLNDPSKSMGHCFVLAMLLLNDPALNECRLRRATLDWLKSSG